MKMTFHDILHGLCPQEFCHETQQDSSLVLKCIRAGFEQFYPAYVL